MKKLITLLLMMILAFSLAGCTDSDKEDPLTCPDGQHVEGETCVDDIVDDVCEAPMEVLEGECRALTKDDCEVNELFITQNGKTYCYPDPDYRPVGGEVPKDDEFCKASEFYYNLADIDYQLVWNDEFDGDELDSTKWKYEINGYGGGNNELQYYTDENTEVSDGTLKIIARNEVYNTDWNYTSSRITTQYKQTFKYGKFEARIKLPEGRGSWSAFWMMPDSSAYGTWPDSGEIDIMEHVGYDGDKTHSTIHTERFYHKYGTQKGDDIHVENTSDWHVYSVEWLPNRMIFSVDGEEFFTYNPASYSTCPGSDEWPFDRQFFMILNVAIGGDWGGVQGVDNSMFPMTMEVDYVRVYQSENITNIVQGE